MRFRLRKLRLRFLLFLLERLSRHPVHELLDATQEGIGMPPDVLIRKNHDFYRNEGRVVELAYQYKIAMEHDPVVQDLFGRLYQMHQDLGQAILQGRRDEWGNDLTDGYRKAFGVLENIIAIPGLLQARKEEIEEVGYGLPPVELDTTPD